MNTFKFYMLIFILFWSLSSQAAKPAPTLPNQKVVYGHQTSVTIVHPDPLNPSTEQLGDLVSTTGYLTKTPEGPSIGNYWVQKTLIGFNGTNAVRSNLVFFNITDDGPFNGTLYVEGINETLQGQTHGGITKRPIIGGTGRYTAAKGIVETESLTGILVKSTFKFYR